MIDMLLQIEQEISLVIQFAIVGEIMNSGMKCIPSAKLSEVTDLGIVYEDAKGDKHTLNADNVLFATGLKAENNLYNELLKDYVDVYPVGDCTKGHEPISVHVLFL
ncbi:hypothetical protein EZV73_10755 [Acidaminobacter sp. JC074]|uniref:NAD(P)/FAD-dependent oxidoreductase n=1 Tax=Acidaminobacter sp. JC074 TaxID=2530199 RepID=UPI001F0D53DE|nr:NAD(P)/FAD-dependent oxidoreductase [Acidaminobacter sp. JC074]MCH4888057.1 hypothetical protein [Acidaminobacter sp. JC074]